MFVAESYFPHLRAAEEARLQQALERRRVQLERSPAPVRPWLRRIQALVAGPRRRVEECCETLQQAAADPAHPS